MVHMYDKLKIKNLTDEVVEGVKIYKGDIYAGYNHLGSITTNLTNDFEEITLDMSPSDLRILEEESMLRSYDNYSHLEEEIESLVVDLIKENKIYDLLEVPRDFLRDYVKENPNLKYFTCTLLYVRADGTGSISNYQTEVSTQSESFEEIIRRTGLAAKEEKQAVKILGFHYVSLRKIVTTEIL